MLTEPREKLLTLGKESLSDAELLAILLRTGIKGVSAVDLARDAIKTFGSLNALLTADFSSYKKIKGLGGASYVALQAVLEIAKRYMYKNICKQRVLDAPNKVIEYIKYLLQNQKNEVFGVLFMDSKLCVLGFEIICEGGINKSSINLHSLVLKTLSEYNAAAIILAHNHPSGKVEPSKTDYLTTKKIKTCMEALQINVIDHLIIGDNSYFSFADNGKI